MPRGSAVSAAVHGGPPEPPGQRLAPAPATGKEGKDIGQPVGDFGPGRGGARGRGRDRPAGGDGDGTKQGAAPSPCAAGQAGPRGGRPAQRGRGGGGGEGKKDPPGGRPPRARERG